MRDETGRRVYKEEKNVATTMMFWHFLAGDDVERWQFDFVIDFLFVWTNHFLYIGLGFCTLFVGSLTGCAGKH